MDAFRVCRFCASHPDGEDSRAVGTEALVAEVSGQYAKSSLSGNARSLLRRSRRWRP